MNRSDRWNRLLELVTEQGRVDVCVTARELGVSEATIRRDLDGLAARQALVRTRGGAVRRNLALDLPFRYRRAATEEIKQRIGAAAAALVRPGSTVVMNGGTTVSAAADALLATLPEAGPGPEPTVRVVTNALNVANTLAVHPGVRLVVTGGVARPHAYELGGPLARGVLEQFTYDVALIGVDGLVDHLGAMTFHENEAHLSALMAERAERVVILADASKLGRRAFAAICEPEAIDVVITDRDAPAEVVAGLEGRGIEVILA